MFVMVLNANHNVVEYLSAGGQEKSVDMYKITQEGRHYLQKGFPERHLLQMLRAGRRFLSEINIESKDAAVYWAKRNRWIKVDGNEAVLTFFGRMSLPLQKLDVEKALSDLDKTGTLNEKYAKELLGRRLIEELGREHLSLKLKNMFWKKDEADGKGDKHGNAELRSLKKKFYGQQKEIREMQDYITMLEKRLRALEQGR